MNEGVSRILKYAKNFIFKNTTFEFDEKILVTRKHLCYEDDALNLTPSEPLKSKKIKG